MGLHMRKSTILVSNQLQHKLACAVTEDRQKLEILYLSIRGILGKTKALIICAATAQLICIFVFTKADRWFSVAGASSCEYDKR